MSAETNFDISKCKDCPLKGVFARFVLHNQVANTKDSQLTPIEAKHFRPTSELSEGDYQKFKVLAQAENPHYTVDDRNCEGTETVTDFVVFTKLQCGAQLIAK
jgi:hypothetical protein